MSRRACSTRPCPAWPRLAWLLPTWLCRLSLPARLVRRDGRGRGADGAARRATAPTLHGCGPRKPPELHALARPRPRPRCAAPAASALAAPIAPSGAAGAAAAGADEDHGVLRRLRAQAAGLLQRLALPDPVHAPRAGTRVPEQPLRAERRAAGAAGGALSVRAQLQRARAQRGRARVPAVCAAVPHHPGHPPLAARGRGRAGARAASGAARAQACPACVHTFDCMPAVRKRETAGGLGVQASRSDNDGATSACRALRCRACAT